MIKPDSPAVAIASSHIEAWSNHDYDKARGLLADDVKVLSSTTQPFPPRTDTSGADEYMVGLKFFADKVVPGSAKIVAATGDRHNALIMVTVEADLGGGKLTLPAARLYLVDDQNKIKSEQVVFYAAEA